MHTHTYILVCVPMHAHTFQIEYSLVPSTTNNQIVLYCCIILQSKILMFVFLSHQHVSVFFDLQKCHTVDHWATEVWTGEVCLSSDFFLLSIKSSIVLLAKSTEVEPQIQRTGSGTCASPDFGVPADTEGRLHCPGGRLMWILLILTRSLWRRL